MLRGIASRAGLSRSEGEVMGGETRQEELEKKGRLITVGWQRSLRRSHSVALREGAVTGSTLEVVGERLTSDGLFRESAREERNGRSDGGVSRKETADWEGERASDGDSRWAESVVSGDEKRSSVVMRGMWLRMRSSGRDHGRRRKDWEWEPLGDDQDWERE